MTISTERFNFALSKLTSGDWQRFERLCSAFLAPEFSGLRTMASPGGDRGRDAELYQYGDAPKVLIQYSVQANWKSKLADTLKKIDANFKDVTAIIFMSSQEIGAQGDKVSSEYRKNGINLDIRDRSWFLVRMGADSQRVNASTDFSREIVDPILSEKGIINSVIALSGRESKTALVFLELQARDENSAKGLTKASFESLVKAALHGSNEENLISRDEIHSRINRYLPRHSPQQLAQFIDSAIERMAKNVIKRHPNNYYHLSFEESERTKDRLAGLALLSAAFSDDVNDIAYEYHSNDDDKKKEISNLIQKTIEIYLYRLGEEFAQAVAQEREIPLHQDILSNVILETVPRGKALPTESWSNYLTRVTMTMLSTPSQSTKEFLRVLSTGYTLFAFLEEVPDVQKVTKKLFSNASILLDTSVVLPIFAEYAYNREDRPFTDLMIQAYRSGIKLTISHGILEEIERHLSLCKSYTHKFREWEGRVPYVFYRYILAGKQHDRFTSWLENFMGDHRPLDDLADFLFDIAKIELAEPKISDDLDGNMVSDVKSYWHEVQERRRGDNANWLNSYRLAEHDIENYLSVLADRKQDRATSALGYRSWLMSLDSAAWNLKDNVSSETARAIGHSPLISVDFLVKYLSFGPRRDQASSENGYSVAFQPTLYESISPELISAAEQIRASCEALPERQIRRKIRDGLDKQKMTAGSVQMTGLDGAHKVIASLSK